MKLALSAILLVSAILSCAAQWHFRPRRPERFDTAEQISDYLKELQEYYSVHGRGRAEYPRSRRPEPRLNTANYLKELQDYYSVHGRGRYGKRQMHIADASVTFRESPIYEQSNNINDDPLFKNLGYDNQNM